MRDALAAMLDAFADDPKEFFRRVKVLKRRAKRKLRELERSASSSSVLKTEAARLIARVAARRVRRSV